MVRIGGLGLDLGVDVEVVVGLEVEGMDEIWNLGRMSSLPPPPLLVQASPNAITLANTAD